MSDSDKPRRLVWLERLPALVAQFEQQWSLTIARRERLDDTIVLLIEQCVPGHALASQPEHEHEQDVVAEMFTVPFRSCHYILAGPQDVTGR